MRARPPMTPMTTPAIDPPLRPELFLLLPVALLVSALDVDPEAATVMVLTSPFADVVKATLAVVVVPESVC